MTEVTNARAFPLTFLALNSTTTFNASGTEFEEHYNLQLGNFLERLPNFSVFFKQVNKLLDCT